MSTTIRSSRLADFGSRTNTDDSLLSSKHAPLDSTFKSGALSWVTNNIWGSGTIGSGNATSTREISRSREHITGNEIKKGSGSLGPSTGLDPWRSSHWTSTEPNPSDLGARRASAIPYNRSGDLPKLVVPQTYADNSSKPLPSSTSTFLGQVRGVQNLNRRASDQNSSLYTTNYNGNGPAQNVNNFGRVVEHGTTNGNGPSLGPWADSTTSSMSPTEDRRSTYFGALGGMAARKEGLQQSRCGLAPVQYPQMVENSPWYSDTSGRPPQLRYADAYSQQLDHRQTTPCFEDCNQELASSFDRLAVSDQTSFGHAAHCQSSNPFPFISHSTSRSTLARPKPQDYPPDYLASSEESRRYQESHNPNGISERPFADQYEVFREIPSGHLPLQTSGGSEMRRVYSGSHQSGAGHSALGTEMITYPQRDGPAQNHSEIYTSQMERKARWPAEQDPLVHSYMQQMMAAQLRYGNPFAYAFPPDLQVNGLPAYMQMGRMPPIVINPLPVPELEPGSGIRSFLMEEFKSNNKGNRRFELRDIYDHIAEFAGDQHGSRFIQQKLETANSDEKERVFKELQQNSTQLMIDVFGNWVIQKFFEHGDQNQKKVLANRMKGQVLNLSLNVYGCRVVQKALEHVLIDQQAAMVRELQGHVLKCVKDQNGNHVIGKVIERVPAQYIQFIIDAFIGQVQHLATHPYGCRVVQRLLERCEEPAQSKILQELHACAPTLIVDQYGNYVIQHVIQHGTPDDRAKIISLVRTHLVAFSKQKFASNVVEKSLLYGTDERRREIMYQLMERNEMGECALSSLIKDAYGNYVIQRLLDTLNPTDYVIFIEILNPEIAKAKRLVPNKQAENVAKKMHRFDVPFTFHHHTNPNLCLFTTDRSQAPTPALTADGGHSPISSSLPSTTDEVTLTNMGVGQKTQDPMIKFEISEP